MNVPFVDLKTQYAELKDVIQTRINNVLDHGRYINGPEVAELEGALAEMTGVEHVVGCSNGTDALVLALMAHGVGPGDAVFTVPFTYVATVEAIQWVGARPVFVDIDAATYNIDPNKLATAIEQTKAEGKHAPRCIMAVDLFGQPADYQRLRALADKHDLLLLGDGAQSMGSHYQGKPSATWPDIYTTSFFPAKPLGCYGDGGAVFTPSADIDELLRSLRVHGGGKNKYDTVRLGMNGRLDTLQAAVLLAKLPSFPAEIERRNQVAKKYSERLAGQVETPVVPEGYQSAWAQYSVQSNAREAIRAALSEAGIPTAVYYERSLHLQPSLSAFGGKPDEFPVAEQACQQIFSLPMHPFLKDADIDRTCEIITATVRSAA